MSSDIKTELDEGLKTPDNKYTRKDVEQLTVTQLRAKLKSMKLPVYGCKRTLCQRILMISSDASSQVSRNTFPLFDRTQSLTQDNSTHSSIGECKLVDLRIRCKKVGLPSSGRKQELIDRLEVYYEKALLSDIDTKMEPPSFTNIPFMEWHESNLSRENAFFEEAGSSIFGPPLGCVQIDPYSVQNETELASYTKHALKSVCKRLNLKVSGRKEEIIQRVWTHVSQSKSSLILESSAESRRKRPKHCLVEDLFDPFGRSSLKSRLRSNSASKALPEVQSCFTSESLNNRLHLPLSRRYYVFASKFGDNSFECTVCSAAEDRPVTVNIGENMSCSCQEFANEFLCQHILFIFLRILKISSDNPLLTKPKLLPTELDFVLKGLKQAMKSVKSTKTGIKKRVFTRAASSLGDDTSVEVIRENWAGKHCGICFEPFGSNDSMIWCRMNCGKNMHMLCYEKWVEQQETAENKCPYCLMPWSFIPKNTRFQRKQKVNRVEWKDG